jgi:CheY-like chemotaxis protein
VRQARDLALYKKMDMNSHFRIVIVDDDRENKRLLEIVMEEAYISNPCTFVYNGLELLEFLKQSSDSLPGIILLDMNMPQMGGLATLKQLKENEVWKKIPVIMFSTSDHDGDIERSYLCGASSYIVKPDSFEKLIYLFKMLKVYWFECVRLPKLV